MGAVDLEPSVELEGDFIRFVMGDHAGSKLAYDVSTANEATGGYITDTWAHLVVSVDGPGSKVMTTIDGKEITRFGTIPARPDPALDWTQSSSNLAWPGIPTLSGPLGAFALPGGSNGNQTPIRPL